MFRKYTDPILDRMWQKGKQGRERTKNNCQLDRQWKSRSGAQGEEIRVEPPGFKAAAYCVIER